MFYEQDVISLKCANGDKCPIITSISADRNKVSCSSPLGAFDVLDCLSMIGVKLFIFLDYFVPFRQTTKAFFPPPGDCFADGLG